MSEVRYSVNGKYFKDFGIYISSSDGLFDALKRKKVNTYDWAEYHGSSPDLSNPKFEQREISLKGFVTGANWEEMKSNFDAIISEFQKAGTQRLLIEPFGLKPLPYEVCMIDDVNLNKTFKDGKMVGVFTLKLIEPNPLKIVLYTNESTLNLSYNSPQETEIFYGNGQKDTAKGNVSASGKSLANRVVSKYNFEGRNLFKKTTVLQMLYSAQLIQRTNDGFQIMGSVGNDGIVILQLNLVAGEQYAFSFDAYVDVAEWTNPLQLGYKVGSVDTNLQVGDAVFLKGTLNKKHLTFTFRVPSEANTSSPIYLWFNSLSNQSYYFSQVKLEKGNKSTDWTPAPEDEKHIIIAGNIEQITDLTTNADVLWEKL